MDLKEIITDLFRIIYIIILICFGGTWASENILIAGMEVILAGMFIILSNLGKDFKEHLLKHRRQLN